MIWNFSHTYSKEVLMIDRKKCFIPRFNDYFMDVMDCNINKFNILLSNQKVIIKRRALVEKKYLQDEIKVIKNYSKEKAIMELIKSRKINERITQIDSFVRRTINAK